MMSSDLKDRWQWQGLFEVWQALPHPVGGILEPDFRADASCRLFGILTAMSDMPEHQATLQWLAESLGEQMAQVRAEADKEASHANAS